MEVTDRRSGVTKAIHVDVGDSPTPDARRARLADACWVRSYTPGFGRPLGLFSPMRWSFDVHLSWLVMAMAAAVRNRRIADLRALASGVRPPLPLRVRELVNPAGGEPVVLYQVVAWDPVESSDPDERDNLNDARARLIVALRDAFGRRFVGGFVPTTHSRRAFPGLLTDQPTDRPYYLRLVAASGVVVGGIGLHHSTPWKLAEYLAASRAIVCERLRRPVPEPLDDVVTWFDDPAGCVAACDVLLQDADQRAVSQMLAGQYWEAYVRPDRLLFRRLDEEVFGAD